LELQRDAGGTMIGLDWRVDLADGWRRLGDQNLGHGIVKETPVDHVRALVDMFHAISQAPR
jgi:uroporphyrinogen decarboxylase